MKFIEFIVGFILGAFMYAQMIFPIIYCLPKATFLYFKGKLRFIGAISWLLAPILWFVILIMIGFFFPNIINNKFVSSPIFGLGGNLAVIGMLLYAFLFKSGRESLREDFWSKMFKYKTDLSFDDHLFLGNNLSQKGDYHLAIAHYKTATLFDSKIYNTSFAHFKLSVCYFALNKKDEADLEYEKYLTLNPPEEDTLNVELNSEIESSKESKN